MIFGRFWRSWGFFDVEISLPIKFCFRYTFPEVCATRNGVIRRDFRRDFRRGHGAPEFFVIQIKRKLKRKRKQKRKQGSLREGREAPPRRCPPLLRFCFRFRFNLRLI